MRHSRAEDYWRKVKRNCSRNSIRSLHFQGIPGVGSGRLDFNGSISAICGKNGLGKSTILKGILCNIDDDARRGYSRIKRRLESGEFRVTIANADGEQTVAYPDSYAGVNAVYFDHSEACQTQLQAIGEANDIEELKDQVEFGVLGNQDQREIRRILGRDFSEIEVAELDSVREDKVIPYFRITRDGISYESEDMALGELAVLTLFWMINRLDAGAVILIEEPENFLTPQAQRYLSDYFAYACVSQNHWFLISTHSEHIVESVGIEDTYVLVEGLPGESVSIKSPQHTSEYLQHLGLAPRKKGLVVVEDSAAKSALETACNFLGSFLQYDYDIIKLDGVGPMKKLLNNFPLDSDSFKVIGIFDGNERGKVQLGEDVNYQFLPGEECPEGMLRSICYNDVCSSAQALGIPDQRLRQALSSVKGEDPHDWLNNLAGALQIQYLACLNGLSRAWVKAHRDRFSKILKEIDSTDSGYWVGPEEECIDESHNSEISGRVKTYFRKKGYGFIDTESEGTFFFHFSNVEESIELSEGDEVIFQPQEEPNRRLNSAIRILIRS